MKRIEFYVSQLKVQPVAKILIFSKSFFIQNFDENVHLTRKVNDTNKLGRI